MIKVYIQCGACGFEGITYENEDLEDEDQLELEEEGESEECPRCGEYAKEVDDDETMERIDNDFENSLSRREERRREVTPFSLGEEDE